MAGLLWLPLYAQLPRSEPWASLGGGMSARTSHHPVPTQALAAAAAAEGRPRYMPTRKALEAGGRGDLVRGVLAAGGFLAVAHQLGLRARRKPQGYWDAPENLEQVGVFAGALWLVLQSIV